MGYVTGQGDPHKLLKLMALVKTGRHHQTSFFGQLTPYWPGDMSYLPSSSCTWLITFHEKRFSAPFVWEPHFDLRIHILFYIKYKQIFIRIQTWQWYYPSSAKKRHPHQLPYFILFLNIFSSHILRATKFL